jgi:hypothetical protein
MQHLESLLPITPPLNYDPSLLIRGQGKEEKIETKNVAFA